MWISAISPHISATTARRTGASRTRTNGLTRCASRRPTRAPSHSPSPGCPTRGHPHERSQWRPQAPVRMTRHQTGLPLQPLSRSFGRRLGLKAEHKTGRANRLSTSGTRPTRCPRGAVPSRHPACSLGLARVHQNPNRPRPRRNRFKQKRFDFCLVTIDLVQPSRPSQCRTCSY